MKSRTSVHLLHASVGEAADSDTVVVPGGVRHDTHLWGDMIMMEPCH